MAKKPTKIELLENLTETPFRSGSGNWGKHGHGENVDQDGRRTKHLSVRHKPKGERWWGLAEIESDGGEHKG